MAKPAGVIVSGVIAILGSVLCLLMGALMLLVLPMSMQQVQAQGVPRGFMYLPVAMMLAFGAWGLLSGIGIVGVRNWARISTLIFAGTLVTLAVIGLPFMLMMPLTPPPGQAVDPGMMQTVKFTMAMFYVVMGLWGAAWLVYFNRARVKEAFRGGAPEPAPNPNPLSIRIIAWMMLTSAPFLLIFPLLHLPATLGGHVIGGAAGSAFYVIWGVLLFAIGYGLLRLQRWSHMAAMILFAFGIVNATIFWLQPGARQRMEEASQRMVQEMNLPATQAAPQMPPLAFSIGIGIFSAALPLYFLILRREKFLAAADAKERDASEHRFPRA